MNPADKYCARPRKRLHHDAVPTIFHLPETASLPNAGKPLARKPNHLQVSKLSKCEEVSSSVVSSLDAEEPELLPQTLCTSAITGDRLDSLTCRSTQMTPRKRKLKLQLNRSRVSISRLKKRLAASGFIMSGQRSSV
jgi:hypothetical protein